jgi:hypothetical protein
VAKSVSGRRSDWRLYQVYWKRNCFESCDERRNGVPVLNNQDKKLNLVAVSPFTFLHVIRTLLLLGTTCYLCTATPGCWHWHWHWHCGTTRKSQ